MYSLSRHACGGEALHIVDASAAVLINNIIDCARVVALVHIEIEHVFADEEFVLHAHNFVSAVAIEYDYIVER